MRDSFSRNSYESVTKSIYAKSILQQQLRLSREPGGPLSFPPDVPLILQFHLDGREHSSG